MSNETQTTLPSEEQVLAWLRHTLGESTEVTVGNRSTSKLPSTSVKVVWKQVPLAMLITSIYHGINAKVGDTAAGAKTQDKALEAMTACVDNIYAGVWSKRGGYNELEREVARMYGMRKRIAPKGGIAAVLTAFQEEPEEVRNQYIARARDNLLWNAEVASEVEQLESMSEEASEEA